MSSDSYPTDDWLKRVFGNWYDPCPLNDNPEFDGLALDWGFRTFCNPPYSNPLPWVRKGIEEANAGKCVVFLLKHDSSTKWFRELHEAGARFLPIHGRLKHGTGVGAPFPSVLVIL